MSSRLLVVASICALAVAATVRVAAQSAPVTVDLKNGAGASVGTATITAVRSGGVMIALNVKNLTPGDHAVHVHQTPSCEGPAFTSAGGHFNPTGKKHGLQNPDGPHAGDMSNFTVGADGTAKTTVTDPRVTLDSGPANSLFANGGTALVIHAKADDMKTDPSGNAGDRVACGVIKK